MPFALGFLWAVCRLTLGLLLDSLGPLWDHIAPVEVDLGLFWSICSSREQIQKNSMTCKQELQNGGLGPSKMHAKLMSDAELYAKVIVLDFGFDVGIASQNQYIFQCVLGAVWLAGWGRPGG